MRIAGLMTIALAAGFMGNANAATILNLNPTSGALSFVDLTSAADQDLDPGGGYASLATAYIFAEGAGAMQANSFTNPLGLAGLFTSPFLLHYDRAPGRGTVSGTFDLQLDLGESLFGWVTSGTGLSRTDFVATADYPEHPGAVRGLEAATDHFNVLDLGGGQYRISYLLDNTENTVDEARLFVISAGVPEPASWTMMIAGFGLAGGAMRYRRRRTALRFA